MSVNKVILVGHAGKDPEVRYLENNRVVATFSLATHEVGRDKAGNRLEHTEWHSIELWDELARIAEKYVRKGKLLYLEGKIRTTNWTDKDGQKKTNRFIRGTVLTFLGSTSNPAIPSDLQVLSKVAPPSKKHPGENDT